LSASYPFERKNELIIAYHVEAAGVINLNEELVDYRAIEPSRLRPVAVRHRACPRRLAAQRGLEPNSS